MSEAGKAPTDDELLDAWRRAMLKTLERLDNARTAEHIEASAKAYSALAERKPPTVKPRSGSRAF